MPLSLRCLAVRAALIVTALVPASSFAQTPSRWVSAGGSLTEWVVALGGESRLVGVDTTSQHPERIRQLPSIGYERQLSAEGILSLHPNLLLATEEVGPPPVLTQLRAAKVQVEMFSNAPDVQAVQLNLQHLGQLLGDEPRAAQVFADYQQQLDAVHQWAGHARGAQAAPGVLMLLGAAGGKPLIGGQGTAAQWVISEAGGRNLATHQGYKTFSTEMLAALNPDVIVFADRSLHGEAARAALLRENPALASTRAARDGRMVELDPTLLVGGLGPRLPHSLMQLARALYPLAAANP